MTGVTLLEGAMGRESPRSRAKALGKLAQRARQQNSQGRRGSKHVSTRWHPASSPEAPACPLSIPLEGAEPVDAPRPVWRDVEHAGVAADYERLSDVSTVDLEVAKRAAVPIERDDVGSEAHPPGEELARELRRLLAEALSRAGVLGCVDQEDSDPGPVLELHRVAIDDVADDRVGGRCGRQLVLEVPEPASAVRLLAAAREEQKRDSDPGRSSSALRDPLAQLKFHTAQ